jgi:hypothetical protein
MKDHNYVFNGSAINNPAHVQLQDVKHGANREDRTGIGKFNE